MSVTTLNAARFDEVVRDGQTPVVIDFYADWCGPCRNLAPIVDALSKRYEGRVTFAKVNIDDEPEIAAKYHIRSIPAVVLFERGDPRARSIGMKSAAALTSELGLSRYAHQSAEGEDVGEREPGLIRRWWAGR